MSTQEAISTVNTNPMVFEELATSLATLAAYARGDMEAPFRDMEHLYERALQEPPSYSEITALTGNSLTATDRQRGRAAWLLTNIEDVTVYGVHTRVWHNVGKKYSAPLLKQMSLALGVASRITHDDMQQLGTDRDLIDVVAVHDKSIWLVQVVTKEKVVNSVFDRIGGVTDQLFRSPIYANPSIEGDELASLVNAHRQMRIAFPTIDVVTFVLLLDPDGPDFELYHVTLPSKVPDRIKLDEDSIRKNSIEYADMVNENRNALFKLPHLLKDKLFRGLPPCRGGRTLGMLALAATRQLEAEELLQWRQPDFIQMLRDEFDLEVERDKVRHDLDDRLVAQGFFRKSENTYYVSMKGLVRYHYCLAKFTSLGSPDFDLDQIIRHRDRILKAVGCLH